MIWRVADNAPFAFHDLHGIGALYSRGDASSAINAVQFYLKKRDLTALSIENDYTALVYKNWVGAPVVCDVYVLALRDFYSRSSAEDVAKATILEIRSRKHDKVKSQSVKFENGIDAVTSRLMLSALPMHGQSACPKCRDQGHQIKTAWMCRKGCGIIGGF